MSFIKIVKDDTFETEVLKSATSVLVDFWVEWCGPCRPLGQKLDEISKELEDKVKIVKVNVADNPITAKRYGVRSVPAMILFKDGIEKVHLIGNHPKETIIRLLSHCD